jgi:hypothetical protein
VVQRVRISTASYVRQARAIVALRKLKFYEGLKLPDLAGFHGESVETPKRSLPRPIDITVMKADGSYFRIEDIMEVRAPLLELFEDTKRRLDTQIP